MSLVAADVFTDLVLHVLAHVRVPGPENLFDARYVAWSDAHLPPSVAAPLHADAELLGRAWCSPDGLVLHAWPELHRDWAGFVATRGRPLAEVRPDEVDRPDVLARLQRCTPTLVEIVHAQLALLAPRFAELHAEVIAPAIAAVGANVEVAIGEATAIAPSLAAVRVELAWPLGSRGRGFSGRVVVGAPVDWNGLDPWTPAVLALHEHAVQRAGDLDYVDAEWWALIDVAHAMVRGSADLRAAHDAWITTLRLETLLAALVQRGTLDAATVQALREPTPRGEMLLKMPRRVRAAMDPNC